jgi:hypothetical protein
MVIYLHEALDKKIGGVTNQDMEDASIEGAVQRLRRSL